MTDSLSIPTDSPSGQREQGRNLSPRAQFAQSLGQNDDLRETLREWLEGWVRQGTIALMHLDANDPTGMAYSVRRGAAYFEAFRNTARDIEAQFAQVQEAA